MIIGKISENEKSVRFDVEIHCTSCGKKVPGGLKTGEKYFKLKNLKQNQRILKEIIFAEFAETKKEQENNYASFF